ncbi:hypothetical protein GPECTOR_13g770 [Gonium pectorale]|uniref:Protein kinase domain-containing protein n=1 Tax=Gonium pectorale TaxID=33097 RepID=A0A150GN68_GONPE|nr:hypothetical protein GPECTOR_13g770 [Gonium pectorale]|eukprot:KXZ51283.1 hypothetical protein GPECTOR_13g770 [Gonium pectorale]
MPAEPLLKKVKIAESPSTLAGQANWHRYAFQPSLSTAVPLGRPAVPESLDKAAFFGFRPMASLPANIPPELVSPAFSHILEAVAAPAQPPTNLGSCMKLYTAVRELLVLGSGLYTAEVQLHEKYYQKNYKDGGCWESAIIYRAGPLPALILLLEGPRLSIHAVWTIYQNRIAYSPLTPSYYLANELHNTANLWKLMAVLAAYTKAVQELSSAHTAMCNLDANALDRLAHLRVAAQVVEGQGGPVVRPCTLPYSLVDESLGLSDISFHGPGLLYVARQRVEGGEERRVLVKFVAGRYGAEVHRAWHAAGVAPALYDVRSVGGNTYVMVIMELLSPEDGWTPLGQAPQHGGGKPLIDAVREALKRAHAAPLAKLGQKAVHGDVRCPNILVRGAGSGSAGLDVRIIDYDWAGPDGEATYPQAMLSPAIRWHDHVHPGAVMRQEHDTFLLDRELARCFYNTG